MLLDNRSIDLPHLVSNYFPKLMISVPRKFLKIVLKESVNDNVFDSLTSIN